MLWAEDRVDVVEGQELSIRLGLMPAAKVTGRVIVAPPSAGLEPPRKIEVRLMSSSATSVPSSAQRALVNQDGRFVFQNVPPGAYQVSVDITAERSVWVSESAQCGLVDALDVPCNLPQAEEILVSVTDQSSGVAGRLDSGEGMSPSDLEVVAFSTTEADWRRGGRRLKVVRPGADGQFECELPSGIYYVGVITPVGSDAITSEMLRRLAASSVQIVVPRRQVVYQELRVAR